MNETQFIVVPLTGIQICRRLPLTHLGELEVKRVWAAAKAHAARPRIENPLLAIVQNHIACDQVPAEDSTGWIACNPVEAVYFRLLRLGNAEYAIDIVIDTQNGAGKQPNNLTHCEVKSGWWFNRKRHRLATIVVEPYKKPRNEIGTLILDFGNTATSAIFTPREARPLEVRPISFHNPWDPFDAIEDRRPPLEKPILKSTTFVLRVPQVNVGSPWVVLGGRADELIRQEPASTSLFAPKKYVRDWPPHLQSQEPTTVYRGVVGQHLGLFPMLKFVHESLRHVLELVLSSRANPTFASRDPVVYSQVAEVLLTYPLTWREADKQLFQRMVKEIADQQLQLDDPIRANFRVELICSEPVAVATYALWEVFFRLFDLSPANLRRPSLASSLLGNSEGEQELRLLVVDIGGGSTDIALLEAKWETAEDATGNHVNVSTWVLESLRFNRAGDRLSHILATAILNFLHDKHGIEESLDFSKPSKNLAFTSNLKREVVSRIMQLVEQAKAQLASDKEAWILPDEDENALVELFKSASDEQFKLNSREPHAAWELSGPLEISAEVFQSWVEKDFGSAKTHGEPGFMDIFLYLAELRANLEEANWLPHLVILSGRTTRLPFIKQLTARHLRMPFHRVRTLGDLLPDALKSPNHQNMDKLSVVYGAHRLRFGEPIRFFPKPEERIFKRFLGTLTETMVGGWRINRELVARGDEQPATRKVLVQPNRQVFLGHAFRNDSLRAEIIATLSNNSAIEQEVEIEFIDDYSVRMTPSKKVDGVILTEWVPGGTNLIVDNFNDTGRVDAEPEGFLTAIIRAT